MISPYKIIPFNRAANNMIPFKANALFWLDGTISGNSFVDKSGNNRNFTISNKDFEDDWVKGFPYKSDATISAPIGDATLIAADINNFLYDSGGTPNEIPVVSLFQNIDYEDKLFCRHGLQSVNTDYIETYAGRVLDIVLYDSILNGTNLITANSYYSVPVKETTNVLWVGSGETYTTIQSALNAAITGDTIYVKSGEYNEECSITNKGITVIGIGLSRNYLNTGSAFLITNTTTSPITIKGLDISGASRSIYVLSGLAAKLTVEKCILKANNPSRKTSNDSGIKIVFQDCITEGQHKMVIDDMEFYGCRILEGTNSIILSDNLISRNTKYDGGTTIIQRGIGTISIVMTDDNIVGSVFLDEAISTTCSIILNYCNLFPTGFSVALTNSTNNIDLTITNSTITQQDASATTAIYFKGNNLVFSKNTVINQNNNIINGTALNSGKTFLFSENTCNSNYIQFVLSFDYLFTAHSNIMVSEISSGIKVSANNYNSIPANIYNNYMVSKNGVEPFVLIGTEYTTATDGYLNGSLVYNNRFSAPLDWGNDPTTMHGVFTWNQAVNWHHNYLSGSNLGFVLKSNGGTYANIVHSNLIKDMSSCITAKGIKGIVVYNNTCYNAAGYDALSETEPGYTGDSGNNIIKNNIFYTDTSQRFITISDATNAIGVVSNYNILYNSSSYDKVANVGGTAYTFSEWNTYGQDNNSLNENPDLVNLIPNIGSPVIDNGETLASAYDDGLDISTNWGSQNETPTIITKQQVGLWDIGSYII